MRHPKHPPVDLFEVRRLAVEALVCDRAAKRWWTGGSIKPLTGRRLELAAERLGIELVESERKAA